MTVVSDIFEGKIFSTGLGKKHLQFENPINFYKSIKVLVFIFVGFYYIFI